MSQYPQQPVPVYADPHQQMQSPPPPHDAHAYAQPPPQQMKPEYAQQGIPLQTQPQPQVIGPGAPGGGQQYHNATPIAALGRGPAPVDCPACMKRAMTSIQYETGNTTHAWALALCCCLCLGCVPYIMNGLKDVAHKCGNCGVLLATWHRSGTTEVHMHS